MTVKIGLLAGVFDLCHPGHIHAISFTKNYCDCLTVLIKNDPTIDNPLKNKPIQSIWERWYQVYHLSNVDEVIPYNTEYDLLNIYSVLNYDMVFIGEDHVISDMTGYSELVAMEKRIISIPRFHDYSTTELRKLIINKELEKTNVRI